MIIDLLDKLIDRCIQLIKHSQEAQQKLFDDFATPVYQTFEMVHDEYIKSFRTYRDIIKKEKDFSIVCDSLCEKIEEDILFNASLRAKLIELSSIMDDPVFGDFVREIHYYTMDYEYVIVGTDEERDREIKLVDIQRWRNSLIRGLKFVKVRDLGEEGTKYALKELKITVARMQRSYSRVTRSYAELKLKLNH